MAPMSFTLAARVEFRPVVRVTQIEAARSIAGGGTEVDEHAGSRLPFEVEAPGDLATLPIGAEPPLTPTDPDAPQPERAIAGVRLEIPMGAIVKSGSPVKPAAPSPR